MKYKLKRSSSNLIIASIGAAIFLLGFIVLGDDIGDSFFFNVLVLLIFIGIIVYEIGRLRGDKFFFDENGFSVDGESYSYTQIDYLQVYAVHSRYRHTENIDIFVNDQYIFGFNKNYENSGKFLDFAQNYNVKIKVGLTDD